MLSDMSLYLRSPERLLTAKERDDLIAAGGYVHELFQSSKSNLEPPFPGEALLLFAGGLVEQTAGLPAGLIALVEISSVTFATLAIPPVTIFVQINIDDPTPTPGGSKVIWPMTWTLCSESGEHLSARIKMLGTQ